jgi:diguanylate cyclase (GGDEF)-like protein/PAS domain S-box-containing protein
MDSVDVDLVELKALRLASNTRLLVVDDEPRVVASLEALLKHKHYQVDTALGGKLACQQLEQNHYDAVLLDLNMGNFDGFAVMAYMADQSIDAAIVVVSGETTFDAVRKALRLGASDYVKKPYAPEELFSTIDLALHKNTWRIDGRVAKARLQAKNTPDAELSMVDAQKLLQELEVHQIQLEMQNESLLEAIDAEKLALHRYTELFDFAPIGYFILDPTSKIMQVNSKGTHLLGIEKSNLAGRRFLVYIALEYRVIFCGFLENAFDLRDKQNCEILVQVGKHELWLRLEANIGASATECLVAMVDISERKQAEEELRKSNTLFSQAEAIGNMGHFYWDLTKDKLISCSDQYARIYGKTVPEALACFTSTEAVMNLIHPDDKERFKQNSYCYNKLTKGFDGEFRIITSSGDTRHLYERDERVLDNDGEPSLSIGTLQDITESKQAELREKSRTHILELISSGEPLPVILEAIVRVVEQEKSGMLSSILLLDDAGKRLLSGAAPSLPNFFNEAIHGTEIGMGVGSCGTAAFINERVIVDDIQTHSYWVPYKELASKAKLGACWSEPIRSTKGEVLGTFTIYHRKAHYPTEANLAVIEKTAGLASIAIEKRQTEEKLERMAHYDVLTDLPNRVLLADRLSHAMVQCQRRNQSLAVAYLDLDGFKIANDTYGHDVGDRLLITVSQRMKEALREGDTLARIGGDEFIAVMVDLEKIEDSEPVLKRLLKAAAKPVTLGDVVVQVSASIGVSLYPQDGTDADQLIRNADQAMYVAKQAGKNRYHLFDATQEL